MVLPPIGWRVAWPSIERLLAVVFGVLLAAYLVVLLIQPSAVGRGGR